MSDTTTALIALDWGTSSLRGFRLSAAGEVLETRASAHGIQHLPEPGEAGFEAAFAALCGDWLAAGPVPVVADYLQCEHLKQTVQLIVIELHGDSVLSAEVSVIPGVHLDLLAD